MVLPADKDTYKKVLMITTEIANFGALPLVIRCKVTRLELIPMAVVIDKFRLSEADEIARVYLSNAVISIINPYKYQLI
jgi:hypothetical protein